MRCKYRELYSTTPSWHRDHRELLLRAPARQATLSGALGHARSADAPCVAPCSRRAVAMRTRAFGWQDGKKFGHAAKTLTLMNSGKLDGSQYRGRVLLSLEIVPAPHGHPFKPSKAGQEMILRPCLSAPLCDTQRPTHKH